MKLHSYWLNGLQWFDTNKDDNTQTNQAARTYFNLDKNQSLNSNDSC